MQPTIFLGADNICDAETSYNLQFVLLLLPYFCYYLHRLRQFGSLNSCDKRCPISGLKNPNLMVACAGFQAVSQQCDERHVYLSPATLVIVPNTMLVTHWRQQIQVRSFISICDTYDLPISVM